MNCCNLKYIPERLHYKNDSVIIESFFIKDTLFRRITEELKDNPFNVSLTDLSHNIGVNNTIEISKSKDVLFSLKEDEHKEVYENQFPIKLEIISLNETNGYNKILICDKKENLKVRILLKHDPICCMYPHCVFQFFIYDDEDCEIEVTFSNYKTTIGHNKYKYLRDKIRQELGSMIIKEEISYKD